MKLFARIVGGRRVTNPTTVYERNRLIRTMPGQTGAMAASRFGYVIS
ncbi:MAG: hypothetical protein JJ969_17495 [Rhizobiaceae bacterium]|jgi:hypothetical protein|nr:hypothetical protein [Rhizobiaceae bacterium]MBO6726320.1 hypothetical protein [Rhizobiaceae bacterium]